MPEPAHTIGGRRPWGGGLACALPAAIIVAICCILPLGWMTVVVLKNLSSIGEGHFSAFRMDLLARTLGYNGAAAIIATLMGLPAGLAMGRGRGLLPRLLWAIVPAALFMPSLAFAYSWSQFVRINAEHFRSIGISFAPGSVSDIFRCIWTLAAWLWAVPACIIGLSLRRMDWTVQQHAMMDGALWRVTLRQLLAPIIASLAAVTILATQEFAVYEPTGISVVATEVRMVFDTGAFSSASNPITGTGFIGAGFTSPDQAHRAAAAVATAMPLLGATLLLAVLAAWGAGKLSAADSVAEADWPKALNTPIWITLIAFVLVLMNVLTPIVTLVMSLRLHFSPITIFEEYSKMANGSLIIGAIAAGFALVVALSAAAKWTRGGLVIAAMSFLMGGQFLAIGMIRICNRHGLLWAYDAWPVTVATYIGRFGWIALLGAKASWGKPWREIRDMAAVDGAGVAQSAGWVIWPLAMPVLLAGALMVGALSLTEVPATVLLSPQNPQVLTPMLMTMVHMSRYDPMVEASLLMMGLVVLPVAGAMVLLSVGRRLRGWIRS